MKFSVALSLGIAPVALAKAVHNVYPVRRDPSKGKGASKSIARQVGGGAVPGVGVGAGVGAVGIDPLILAQSGLSLGTRSEVIVIWVNGGNNAATTTIQAQQTVTQTVTVQGGAQAGGQVGAGAAAPPAAVTPPPAALPPVEGAAPPPAGGAQASGTIAAPGTGATHTVIVGGPKGLQFQPPEIKAAVLDMVVFTFLSQNHTATQSAFDTPCAPLAGGMDSGYQPNANNSVDPPPQVAMQVMVDTPLWFYCRQANHCGKGMTFSINPTAAKTQAMFQQMAIAQNGNGAGSAITGNGGGAPAAAPAPPAAGQPAVAPLPPAGESVAATGTLQALPGESAAAGAAAPVAPAGAAGTGVVTGTGQLLQDGSCQCSVQCAMGAFPAVQAQGVGAFGGNAGALPSNMVAVR